MGDLLTGPAPADFRTCSKCGKGPIKARGLCVRDYTDARRRGQLPPRRVNKKQVMIKFGVPDSTEAALRRRSRVTGHSISALVRMAVNQFLGLAPVN